MHKQYYRENDTPFNIKFDYKVTKHGGEIAYTNNKAYALNMVNTLGGKTNGVKMIVNFLKGIKT